MNERFSLKRQKAEAAFASLQNMPTAADRARQEQDSAAAARQAQTALLRQQRLARETYDKS